MKHELCSLSRLLVLSLMFVLAACTQASPSHTATTVTITANRDPEPNSNCFAVSC